MGEPECMALSLFQEARKQSEGIANRMLAWMCAESMCMFYGVMHMTRNTAAVQTVMQYGSLLLMLISLFFLAVPLMVYRESILDVAGKQRLDNGSLMEETRKVMHLCHKRMCFFRTALILSLSALLLWAIGHALLPM